jgi:hypothetical protein
LGWIVYLDTSYWVGKGKTGKGKGEIREFRTNYVEGEGGFGACKRSNTSRRLWNNKDLKVTIQWLKRGRYKTMRKNKDGVLLWYREMHTPGVATYRHDDAQAAVAAVAATPAATVAMTIACSAFPSASAQSSAATADRSTHDPKTFALAAVGNPAGAHAAPSIFNASGTETPASGTGTAAAGAIVAVAIVAVAAATAIIENPNPPHVPPLDCSDAPFDNHPFNIGIHLDMEAPAMPLCHDEGKRSSDDDDSIFF